MSRAAGQTAGVPGNDAAGPATATHFARAIELRARETLTAAGMLHGQQFSRRRRWRRAAAIWALFWALALAAALIPVVHFVLVPALLIAGPLAAWWRLRQSQAIESATGECPLCHQSITLALDAHTTLPHWDVCPACGGHLQLRAMPDAPGDQGVQAP